MALFDRFKRASLEDAPVSPESETEFGAADVIYVDRINKASAILDEYRKGKQVLEQKTIENEDFWKQRQYECYTRPNNEQYIPASAWLWNCIVNKHSQLVAAYPKFNIIPRRKENEAEAEVLTEIMPIVLRQAGYRKTYSKVSRYKVTQGTGVTGVFWDGNADNGIGNVVLYATENDTEAVTDEMGNVIRPPMSQTGLYADGKYPFVFDVLFEIEGTPTGYGYTDIGKDCQIQIDMLNNAITKNAMLSCKPRWFAREDAAINIGEFLDWSKDIIRVASADLSDVALRQVDISPLGGQYVDVLNNRINELKETLGHRDVNTGGTVAGVTSASGIIALQESSGKIDKATALETYDAQEQIAQMVISRIKQFFTTPRVFRMLDDNGDVKYVEYISKRDADGFPEMPFFDIDITAEQASPYKAISQNELMLQLYQQGFFMPDNAMNALACLDGMDFDGKEDVMATIQSNNTLMQQFVKLAALVDQAYGTNMSMMIGGEAPAPQGSGEEVSLNAESNGHIRKARERAEEASSPV